MITISKKHLKNEIGRSIIVTDGHGLPYYGRIKEIGIGDAEQRTVKVEFRPQTRTAPGGRKLVDVLRPVQNTPEDGKRQTKTARRMARQAALERVVVREYKENCSNLWPNLKTYLRHMLCEYISHLVARGRCPAWHQSLLNMVRDTAELASAKASAWTDRMLYCGQQAVYWFKEHGVEITTNREWTGACMAASYPYKRHMTDAVQHGLEPYDVEVHVVWVMSMETGWICYEDSLRKGHGLDPMEALKDACAKMQEAGLGDEAHMLSDKFGLESYDAMHWRPLYKEQKKESGDAVGEPDKDGKES